MLRKKTSNQNAFGGGIGLANEFGKTMSQYGVTQNCFEEIISNKDTAKKIAEKILEETKKFTVLLERECNLTKQICKMAKIIYPGQQMIEQSLRRVIFEKGYASTNSRFIPEGLNRPSLLNTCEEAGIKVRDNKEGEQIPTKAGIIHFDLEKMMIPTCIKGKPFDLTLKEQIKWRKEEGFKGIVSVEEALFLIYRKAVELETVPWAFGTCRCRNDSKYHDGSQLGVRYTVSEGLNICHCKNKYDGLLTVGIIPLDFIPSE